MRKTLKALKFLLVGPLILLLLVVNNCMTFPGHWRVQRPGQCIGIAWVISLTRVLFAVAAAGGLTAFLAYLDRSGRQG